jgi:GNAT superfamily N-acetyltransferase
VLSPAELADRAAAGLHEHWRAQCGYVAGGETAVHDGLLVTATNLADATLNVGFVTAPPAHPEAALDWFEGWFAARGLHPGIELRRGHHPEVERLLAARGYAVVVRRPAMALHPVTVPDEAPMPRTTVREVADDTDLEAFRAVQAEVFDLTPEVAEAFLPRAAVETPGIRFLLGLHDGVACATSAVSISRYGAGIVGVGTLAAYRRRGLGRAVTVAALRAAGDADVAWLYPSDMARPLYAGLGFATLADSEVWVAPR